MICFPGQMASADARGTTLQKVLGTAVIAGIYFATPLISLKSIRVSSLARECILHTLCAIRCHFISVFGMVRAIRQSFSLATLRPRWQCRTLRCELGRRHSQFFKTRLGEVTSE